MAKADKCPVCEGSGQCKDKKCHGCNGRGWVAVGTDYPQHRDTIWPYIKKGTDCNPRNGKPK